MSDGNTKLAEMLLAVFFKIQSIKKKIPTAIIDLNFISFLTMMIILL